MSDVADIPLETIIAKLRELEPAIKAEGVTRLAVFGSRARGDARPDSDLDALVDATEYGETPAFDLFKVMHLIEDAIGLTTQISERKLLKAAHHRTHRRRCGRGILNAAQCRRSAAGYPRGHWRNRSHA
jgi:predicted nucleotidyltransferase